MMTTTTTSSGRPQYGGTLIIAAEKQEDNLDPLNALTGPFAGTALQGIYEPLIYNGPQGRFLPGLAASWKAESDVVWIFTLKQGIRFHDGTPFDADAVKANYDRHIANPRSVKQLAFLLDSVNVRDKYTVEFKVKKTAPYADFLSYMASVSGHGLIVSPTAVQKYGKDFGRNPVGTGPFKFVEWIDNDHLTMQANEDYWGGRPYVDKVTVRIIPEPLARILALKKGEVHLADIPPQFVKEANQTGVTVRSRGSYKIHMISINNDAEKGNKALQDVRVRQAINYAINRKAIVDAVEMGFAVPATGSLTPELNAPYYNPKIAGYPPQGDIAKAKQLLKEAGYTDGIDLEIEVAGVFANGLSIATIMKQQLAEANIRLNIKNVDFSIWVEDIFRKKTFQMGLHDQAGSTPYGLFQTILYSKGRNLSNINDPTLDSLVEQLGTTTDLAKQKELTDQVTQMEIEKSYQIYLYYVTRIQGWSDKVMNYSVPDPRYWGFVITNKALEVNAWLKP